MRLRIRRMLRVQNQRLLGRGAIEPAVGARDGVINRDRAGAAGAVLDAAYAGSRRVVQFQPVDIRDRRQRLQNFGETRHAFSGRAAIAPRRRRRAPARGR